MENKKFQEQPLLSQQETGETSGVVKIDMLPERLGFIETDELSQIKAKLIEVMTSGEVEEVKTIAARYHVLGELVVDERQGKDFPRAQIGLSVAMALIRRDAGRIEEYVEDLNDALEYASNMGYADVISSLETAKTQALEPISGSAEQPS